MCLGWSPNHPTSAKQWGFATPINLTSRELFDRLWGFLYPSSLLCRCDSLSLGRERNAGARIGALGKRRGRAFFSFESCGFPKQFTVGFFRQKSLGACSAREVTPGARLICHPSLLSGSLGKKTGRNKPWLCSLCLPYFAVYVMSLFTSLFPNIFSSARSCHACSLAVQCFQSAVVSVAVGLLIKAMKSQAKWPVQGKGIRDLVKIRCPKTCQWNCQDGSEEATYQIHIGWNQLGGGRGWEGAGNVSFWGQRGQWWIPFTLVWMRFCEVFSRI